MVPNVDSIAQTLNITSLDDLKLVNKIKEELIAECENEQQQNNRISVMSESDKLSETSSDSGNGQSELLANQDESYDDIAGCLSSIEHHNGDSHDYSDSHEICTQIKEELEEQPQVVPASNKESEKTSSKKSRKSAKNLKSHANEKKVEEVEPVEEKTAKKDEKNSKIFFFTWEI